MRNGLCVISITLMAAATASCVGREPLMADAATAYAADTFGAPTGTKLEARGTGIDTPWTWVKHTVRNPDAAIITGGRVHKDGGNHDAIYYISAEPPSREYDVSADLYVASNVQMFFAGICGRMSTESKTMYVAWYSHSNTRWQLAKFDGGTLTALGEDIQPLEAGKTYRVTLQITDRAKSLMVDGVRRITSLDNTITETGRPGLYFVSQDALNEKAALSGYHIDNFWVATR